MFLITSKNKDNLITFTTNGVRELSKKNKCRLIDNWHEEKGKSKELVSVLRKNYNATGWDGNPELNDRHSLLDIPTHLSGPISPASKTEETTSGTKNYLSFFKDLHKKISPSNYLEIGIRHGRSLAQAECPSIGIDPSPEIKVELKNTTIYPNSSDYFFERLAPTILKNDRDIMFIDGMHLFEYALRDFINCELYSHENSLIIIDDVFPGHPRQALRKRDSQVWTGDIWKLIPCLNQYRPDLALIAVDTSPTGLLVIIKTDSTNQVLKREYNNIINNFIYAQDPEPPASIINRAKIIDPENELLDRLFTQISNGNIASEQAQKLVDKLKMN